MKRFITLATIIIIAALTSCALMDDGTYRRITMSEKGTLKVTTTEYNDDPSMRVDKSVECAIELVDAGVPYDRAEIMIDEGDGPMTLPFYGAKDGPQIATYNPKKFGDIPVTVIAYRAEHEVARWDDVYTIEIGTWFLRAMQIEDSVDRQDLLVTPNYTPSGNIGRHDVVGYMEARIPKGQKLILSLTSVMMADTKPKYTGRVDAHFRLGDYKDRFTRHTGYLEPNRVLDDEPEKWIDGMTGVLELDEGIHQIYIAPSCLGQKTMIKAAYTAGAAHEVGGVLSITARPIDYSIFD